MDLVWRSRRGYTVNVPAFMSEASTHDAAFAPAGLAAAAVEAVDPAAHRVQVITDDAPSAARWCEALQAEGLVADCDEASTAPRLAVVLHIVRRLPDRLGLLRQLRARDPVLPLVVVCPQLRDLDHVLALEMGADDVLDAATGAAVVAARLRALARRRHAPAAAPAGPDRLGFGALWLHLRERRVCLHGSDIALTEGEFEVLWLLASQAGRAVSRADMLRRLRGLPYQRIDRSIDCRVYRIRAKLGDVDGPAQRIRTVRNCGYLFSPAAW